MSTIVTQIEEAVSYIRTQTSFEPEVGIVLGTGLGGLADEINTVTEISYDKIPNFVVSTVESHEGKLIFGTLGVVNFAHGALFMIGAFCTVVLNQIFSLSVETTDPTRTDFLG
ncbi:MAG: hypothetical protein AAFP70_08270, partial [Calditrichota bacterium]